MVFVEYTALEGDRWDLIAWRAYNDGNAYGPIIQANPHVPIRATIAAGTILFIPVSERSTVDAAGLPPWKR